MPTFNYANTRSTAESLLTKFGQTISVRRQLPGGGPAYNPGSPTNTDYSATAVVLYYKNHERDGTLIKAGDKKVMVSTTGLTIEPDTKDLLVIDGEVHTILNVAPLNPGGTVILWEIQARR